MDFTVIDAMHVTLRFVAIAVTPDLPPFADGSSHVVRVTRPDGSTTETSAVIEYRKGPPIIPVLLRFADLPLTGIPLGSKLFFLDGESPHTTSASGR